VTEHNHIEQTNPFAQRDTTPTVLHCQAITQKGQPCRNRPLEGQRYCRTHAPSASATAAELNETRAAADDGASEEIMIGSTAPRELADAAASTINRAPTDAALRNAAAESVQELEIAIRNRPDMPTETRDMAAAALRLVRENLARMAPQPVQQVAKLISENLNSDYLDPDFWRGLGMVLRYQAEETANLIQRRLRGEYTTDPYGMDTELIDLVLPFLGFMYRTWWRVTTEGLVQVPDSGRALLVANHSGVLPWDGAMIVTAIMEEHPAPRIVRNLHLSWFATLPMVAPALAALGQVQALPENAIRLLEEDQLVCVFPEGVKGVGKLFKDRYKLARFGRGGFVQMALRASAPLIPVAVIGAEEIYPMLVNVKPIARLLGFPFFPLTPLFPWLGPLGFVPLPSKWTIVFGEPIPTAEFGPAGADDPLLVAELAERVRNRIQAIIDQKLLERRSVFLG
jgi:1-acyl-sn-glycerol-3-phosphate acyltransferase